MATDKPEPDATSALEQFITANGGTEDIHMCSYFGCDEPAIYLQAASPCGSDCDHMHGVPTPVCASCVASRKLTIVGGIGD